METIALIVVAALATLAVLHPDFSDNLAQRVGLSMAAAGAALRLLAMSSGHDGDNANTLLLCGMAVYAVGTFSNVIRFRHFHRVRKLKDSPSCHD